MNCLLPLVNHLEASGLSLRCRQECARMKTSVKEAPEKIWRYWRTSFEHYRRNRRALLKEMLSGVTVAVMQVPESVAFSFVAHIPPIVGLYSTFFIGLITACIGGKPAMISGLAGALVVVGASLMANDGVLSAYSNAERFEHYLLVMCFAGLLQMLAGILRLSRFIKLIPRPVMVGFLNGLAIVIFIAQLDAFKECNIRPFFDCPAHLKTWMRLDSGVTWISLMLVFSTMVIMFLLPRVPRVGKLVPGSMVALIVGTVFEHAINRPFIHWNTRSVGDTSALSGDLPTFHIPTTPERGWDLGVIFQYAISMAAIGLIESLMTLQALNQLTKTPMRLRDCNQECLAQGLGNFIGSFFHSIGGDTMIGQSTVNILNGATGRLSAFIASWCILLFIVFAYPVIELIPIPSLTGILFIVVIKTFDWGTFKTIPRIPISDTFCIALVTVLAVATNLAIAVVAGVLFCALIYVWRDTRTLVLTAQETNDNRTIYRIDGELNFATVWQFYAFFEIREKSDPVNVVLDFTQSAILDYSALYAVYKVIKSYQKVGKTLMLCNLNNQSLNILRKAGKMINKGLNVVALDIEPLEDGNLEGQRMMDNLLVDTELAEEIPQPSDTIITCPDNIGA